MGRDDDRMKYHFQYPVSDRLDCNQKLDVPFEEYGYLSVSCVGSSGL